MNWEVNILDNIQHIRSDVLDGFMIFISSLGNSGAIWILLSIILLIKYRKIGLTCTLSLIIMQISGNIFLKNIINRVRPYIEYNVDILIKAPYGSSFPSGHTFSSFAVATAIFMWNKKWGIYAYVLAVLIGFSRLYLYVHYPSDVAAGAVLGVGVGVLSYIAVNYFYKYFKNNT